MNKVLHYYNSMTMFTRMLLRLNIENIFNMKPFAYFLLKSEIGQAGAIFRAKPRSTGPTLLIIPHFQGFICALHNIFILFDNPTNGLNIKYF